MVESIKTYIIGDHNNYLEALAERLADKEPTRTTEHFVFRFDKTEVKTLFKLLDNYCVEDLVSDSESLVDDDLNNFLTSFINILDEVYHNDNTLSEKGLSSKMVNSLNNCSNQPVSRLSYKYNNSKNQVLININRVLYLCMHESAADLSMLKDFEEFKESLDIVGRSFVTRSKSIIIDFKEGTSKSKVHIRDTALIAPMGAKSLAAIGQIYGPEFHKVDIGDYRSRMSDLLKDDKNLFERYAIMDARITLQHARSMESFYFTLGKLGVPLTISGISKAYVLKE